MTHEVVGVIHSLVFGSMFILQTRWETSHPEISGWRSDLRCVHFPHAVLTTQQRNKIKFPWVLLLFLSINQGDSIPWDLWDFTVIKYLLFQKVLKKKKKSLFRILPGTVSGATGTNCGSKTWNFKTGSKVLVENTACCGMLFGSGGYNQSSGIKRVFSRSSGTYRLFLRNTQNSPCQSNPVGIQYLNVSN